LGRKSSAVSFLSLSDSRKNSELKLVRKSDGLSKAAQLRLSELTINKLKTKDLGLVGREQEAAALKTCYDSMTNRLKVIEEEPEYTQEGGNRAPRNRKSYAARKSKIQGQKELVFISGPSGVGKSSLAMVLKDEVASTDSGLLVEGKIDLNISMDQPFSSIAKAFGKIFREIKSGGGEMESQIGEDICSVLGGDVGSLIRLIPEMEGIVSAPRKSIASKLSLKGDDDYMKDRWTYSFRALTRILTSYFSPLVLLLDDLQWVDIASLDLLINLISDVQNLNPLMIIGCYRSNEVSEGSILGKGIQSLQEMSSGFKFNFTEIKLDCCKVEDINQMILTMMNMDDPEKTMELAELCMKRTMGNPHFFIEFMSMLERENLVTYNLGLLKWTWNLNEIENSTVSSANVVELLQVRMRKMAEETQLLLQQAACLGPDFNTPTLTIVWKNTPHESSTDKSDEMVTDMLMTLENEMLIELCGLNNYRWVHDKVQEAALALEEAQRASFQFEIGRALLMSLPEKQLEDELFSVVDLLNRSSGKRSLDYAALNLRAANKARNLSAFESAAKYAAKGIAVLPDEKWSLGSALSLELYTLGAQMELALGRYDQANEYCKEVFSQRDWPLADVVPLRMVKGRLMFSVELKFNSAIDYCQDLLQDMGYKLLWSRATVPIQAVSSLIRTIQTLKKKPPDFYEEMGIMTDPNDLAVASLISRIFYSAYFVEKLLLSVLCTCKLVELTLKKGMSEFSGTHLASVGAFSLILMQDYETSRNLCQVALSMQRMVGKTRATECEHIAYAYGLTWTTPIHQCIHPLEDAYITGMRTGETLFAMWNLLSSSIQLPFDLGKPLDRILDTCAQAYAQMRDVSQAGPALVFSVYWQMITKLATPQEGDPTKLEGTIFKPEDHSLRNNIYEGCVHLATGELMVFYDIDKLAERAVKGDTVYEKCFPGFYSMMLETFHRGVALYAMARKTKKRKYKLEARKIRKKITKWQNGGNPNVSHFVTFLNAEQAALSKKYDEAEDNYSKAIVTVARCGYLNHAALFNERYGDFLMTVRNDEGEAMYRWREAVRYYKDWGAHGKANQLEDQIEQQNKPIELTESCEPHEATEVGE